MAIGKAVSSCSLLLAIGCAWAGQPAGPPPTSPGPSLEAVARRAGDLSDKAAVQRAASVIKSSPLYSDPADRKGSNWIGRAFERVLELRPPEPNLPKNINPPSFGLSFLTLIMWFLLVAGVLFLAYLALRHFHWKRGLTRRAKALLAEDEPERTVDEWLTLADALVAQGRHREAVRCLYLACLLRFDEGMVARFNRGETNWEHLARIRVSPKLPEGVDFEPPTRSFDTIWYGKRTRGMPDVIQFREWYESLTRRLREASP